MDPHDAPAYGRWALVVINSSSSISGVSHEKAPAFHPSLKGAFS